MAGPGARSGYDHVRHVHGGTPRPATQTHGDDRAMVGEDRRRGRRENTAAARGGGSSREGSSREGIYDHGVVSKQLAQSLGMYLKHTEFKK